jgi:hypothetical protein
MGGRMGALLKLPLRIGGGFFGGEAMGDSIPSHSLIGLLVQKLNLSGGTEETGERLWGLQKIQSQARSDRLARALTVIKFGDFDASSKMRQKNLTK